MKKMSVIEQNFGPQPDSPFKKHFPGHKQKRMRVSLLLNLCCGYFVVVVVAFIAGSEGNANVAKGGKETMTTGN